MCSISVCSLRVTCVDEGLAAKVSKTLRNYGKYSTLTHAEKVALLLLLLHLSLSLSLSLFNLQILLLFSAWDATITAASARPPARPPSLLPSVWPSLGPGRHHDLGWVPDLRAIELYFNLTHIRLAVF